MEFRILGKAEQKHIDDAMQKLGVAFPKDYCDFLLHQNGCLTTNYEANQVWIASLADYIFIDALFGIDLSDDIDVVSITEMFSYDMLPETILIGESIQHGFLVLVCHGEDSGVYYWDHTYSFEASTDDANMYWIAESFTGFVEMIGSGK